MEKYSIWFEETITRVYTQSTGILIDALEGTTNEELEELARKKLKNTAARDLKFKYARIIEDIEDDDEGDY